MEERILLTGLGLALMLLGTLLLQASVFLGFLCAGVFLTLYGLTVGRVKPASPYLPRCSVCGARLSLGTMYCPNCGAETGEKKNAEGIVGNEAAE
jgi:hypothetical protein